MSGGGAASYERQGGGGAATRTEEGSGLVRMAGTAARVAALRKKGVDAKVAAGDDLLAVLEMVLRVIGALK